MNQIVAVLIHPVLTPDNVIMSHSPRYQSSSCSQCWGWASRQATLCPENTDLVTTNNDSDLKNRLTYLKKKQSLRGRLMNDCERPHSILLVYLLFTYL